MIFLKYWISGYISNPIDINFYDYESHNINLKGICQGDILAKR